MYVQSFNKIEAKLEGVCDTKLLHVVFCTYTDTQTYGHTDIQTDRLIPVYRRKHSGYNNHSSNTYQGLTFETFEIRQVS